MKIAQGKSKQMLGKSAIWIAIVAVVLVMMGAPVWASDAEHGGGHRAVGWVATDWYRVMNFAVLAIGLFLLLKKPAAQALNGRIKNIARELQDLESKKAAAEKQLADFNTQLARLDKEASQIVTEYIRQGDEAKARILKEAEAAADKLKEHARRNIEHEFKQAKIALRQQIVEKALVRAEQLIATKISAEDQTRLVDEYLQKVVA